tara:strand:+ start:859 stop:2010 length:1152 start_codon:yes stop_codon:yes gene_type:complete
MALSNQTNGDYIPMWLLAELTYACPLQCPYCSNPLSLPSGRKNELSTEGWLKAMSEARKLGAVQIGFSGGEPLIRKDCVELIKAANDMGFYCNLITSAIPLTKEKVTECKEAGIKHIQISFQGSDKETNAKFGGTDSFEHKLAMTKEVIAQGIPLGLNFVLHRQNIHQVTDFLNLAEDLGAEFVELANTQYYAWALHNRDKLLPSQEQLTEAEAATNRFRDRHKGNMNAIFVAPDYYEKRPKRCSAGWGTTFITVTPEGDVLPCQSAKIIKGLEFPNVKNDSLTNIWRKADLFNRFRGTEWMKEPCVSCPEKEKDLGGCRCQAFMLTGDACATDPICDKSPQHDIIERAIKSAQIDVDHEGSQPLLFRNTRNSKKISVSEETT